MITALYNQTVLIIGLDVWAFRPIRWDDKKQKWLEISQDRLEPDRVNGYRYSLSKMTHIMRHAGWKTAISIKDRVYINSIDESIVGIYRTFSLFCIKDESLEEDFEIGGIESLDDCLHNNFDQEATCLACGKNIDDLLRKRIIPKKKIA